MSNNDRPTVVQSGSNGGWVAVVIIALLFLAGVWYFMSADGISTDRDVNVKVETPNAAPAEPSAPAEPVAPAAPAKPAAPATNN